MQISKEAFDEWKNEHPISIAFFQLLKDEATIRREMLAAGAVDISQPFQKIGEDVYKALIQADIYEHITEVQLEDIENESNPSGA